MYSWGLWRNKGKHVIENSKSNYITILYNTKTTTEIDKKHLHTVKAIVNHSSIEIISDCNKNQITDPKSIANVFNAYFKNITDNLNINHNINRSCFDKLDDIIAGQLPDNVVFFLHHFNMIL